MVGLTSAAGLVGFLSEPDSALRTFALQRLNEDIDLLWPEVAGSIGQIWAPSDVPANVHGATEGAVMIITHSWRVAEALYEDDTFPERQLAALVAAKVYYQLQEYNESMVFALGAGKLFDIEKPGEFEETILAKCLDTYIALSVLHNPPTLSTSSSQPAFPSHANGSATASASLTSPTTPFSQSTLPSKSLLSRDESTGDSAVLGGSALGDSGVTGHPSPLVMQRGVQKNLQMVIRRIFESCYRTGAYRQVVGIAIEARNLEVLREAILRASGEDKGGKGKGNAGKSEELMEYVLDICMNVVQERGLRNEILRLILELLNDIPNPDYFSIAKCVVYLDQHSMASNMLRHLVESGDSRSLAVAYQISFDLYDNSTQEFLSKVMEELPETEEKKEDEPAANGDAVRPVEPKEEPRETDNLLSDIDGADATSGPSTTVVSRTKSKALSEEEKKSFSSIRDILRGTKTIELNLEFLYRANHADRAVLNKIRDSLEARNSIFHTGVTFANAFMNSGTTNDSFFRDNLEWLGKAVNWSKFTATAALGVIHRGNINQGQKLLEPYLPREGGGAGGSSYSQGGSLYALGLIYTNHGTHVLDYLRGQFRRATEEVVQHGGALGLGVAGMATGSEEIYEELKTVLWSDSAINGEAVGLSMGLVMLGTGNIKALEDMIQYAHDTQHEKIVRGLALGMALIMFGRQEGADELVQGLLEDPDPCLRYGGILTIAMAYAGSGSNKAVRKLLHVAVSDVSDDVRRIAVMSLGFVLFRKPGAVPRMVELLAESYNPHVRYGATMALGIACAGTGLDEAIDLLEPMMKDSVDFVRQGALISLAMILVQQNESMNPKVGEVRKHLSKVVSDRHEDAMAKFGAALGLGIIDAGGRNCTIGLKTQTGNLDAKACVGMVVFAQYWYWFPLTHFLSLSFTPTAIIGVDKELDVPKFGFWSATRPSLFEYPPEQEGKREEAPEKVKTAVLSTTAQAKRRKAAKERQARRESDAGAQSGVMEGVTPTTPKVEEAVGGGDKMDVDEKAEGEKKEEGAEGGKKEGEAGKKKGKEKVGYEIENMSRVLPAQLKFISFPEGGRWVPVKKPTNGVILLLDNQPDEPKSLLELKVKKTAPAPAPGATTGGPSAGAAAQDNPLAAAMAAASAAAAGGQSAGVEERTGAEEAAGVLNAVDEDEEGEEEAGVPREFEYWSDEGEGDVEGED
ncbi:armadillo-type protein [Lineolata rhizophorae]|uniref:26S proteasome regulatory subunit RPN2 n=1 Tax=Lineolata rhizophorae TaxID=578093 RepID=A0A6A6NPZ9_9PEZI|nr:armadillo-type protein [Lineolata rhizophorae]